MNSFYISFTNKFGIGWKVVETKYDLDKKDDLINFIEEFNHKENENENYILFFWKRLS